tara:strand:+ start:535 stop:1452 length:918 start_codon:yes stop_codon:yes gene_type:complete
MTASFADLKRARKTSLESLISETNKLNSPGDNQDRNSDNLWKPTVDKAGNGYAVIRLLPAPVGEDLPWVRVFNHGFQGPGGWYIEDSLTTLGKKDPVSEHNSMLWNSGIESNKDIVRKQKRRLNYITNIYVVSDPSAPENEGKVFLYKFGKKIFDKINDMMNPQFQDEQPVNPFDLWEGANFKLKIRQVEGYRNYDKSEFDRAEPLLDDDDKMESIWKSQHALAEFVNPANFKSYEELQAKLNRVLGLDGGASQGNREGIAQSVEDIVPAPAPRAAPAPTAPTMAAASTDDDDDSMSFFEQLANE